MSKRSELRRQSGHAFSIKKITIEQPEEILTTAQNAALRTFGRTPNRKLKGINLDGRNRVRHG
ncbi:MULTISPECIES: hypothetical protein [Rhizobium/Agrobacterium group]|uniref:hypothetical protein n=1 Tax=Rhizobium/Agrobacterium group TaxID=227290 RepID=UPI001574866D|nr:MULTISPECIES: hypothetical protein [Rhizobium/Agrobacterium group]MCF1449146.1 hypothetical protein [Allorhizobium ampelinum]MCF1473693.1 hypothetical protein [Allorhizobium ampelinum]MCF1494960.1 hypothetical protein [Allorhizobium ampelinum]NSZ55917.1 hypothetical protein [Agrobacterium vitis]NTA35168.1 hypothetical protein [Agrobacterium vitis]